MMISDSVRRWGFDSSYLEEIDMEAHSGHTAVRVTSVLGSLSMVTDGENEIPAELSGKLLYTSDSPMDVPTVGDWVLASLHDANTLAIIQKVLPRKSLLRRKTPGKRVDFQLLGANIDTAFIVQSLDGNFSLRRLERYLVMIRESGVSPFVLLSKSDLIDEAEAEGLEKEIRELMPELNVRRFSNLEDGSWTMVRDILVPGRTYCLLGSSGVGKTSLLNNLVGEDVSRTYEVREFDSKGRHTTTARQMIMLASGAMLIDTPGMRELGNFSVQQGIEETFFEISELAAHCQFSDCSHANEPGCAVIQAVEDGVLSTDRYENFLRMNRESDYGEMSYLEKRQQDRNRGKFYKSVLKQKKQVLLQKVWKSYIR